MTLLRPGQPWWHTVTAALLIALLLGTGASFTFDRDGDGIDDGGLSLCLPGALDVPGAAETPHLLPGGVTPRIALVSRPGSTPRSPPRSPSDSR